MTTTNERINAIYKKRATDDMIAKRKEEQMDREFAELRGKARELVPRITELIDVAKALLDNGYTLGNKVGWWNGHRYESDKIDHNLGFIRNGSTIIGIGKLGGGCSYASIWITPNGELGMDNDGWHEKKSRIEQLKSILDGFDKFETDFYAYVDTL